MKNIIPDFTKDELALLIDKCNFTEQERLLLDLRNCEISLEECAEIMNCSTKTIVRINKRMNGKIIKVTSFL